MIQLLDVRTLFAVWSIVCAVLTFNLSMYWFYNRAEKSAGWWALAMLATACGSFLFVFRGLLPSFISIVLANTLFILGWSLFSTGLRRFFYLKKGIAWEIAPVLVLFSTFLYYTYVLPDLINRILIISILLCIASFRCFYLLLERTETGLKMSSISAGYSSLIISIFFLTRIVLTLIGIGTPQTQYFLSPNFVTVIMMFILIGGYVSLTIGLISLPGRRNRNNLHETALNLERSNLKLQQSEARFQSFYNVAFEGIVFSENARIIDANNRFAEMVELSIEELQGLPVTSVVVPEHRKTVTKNISTQFEDTYESVLLTKEGHNVNVEVHAGSYNLQGRNVRVSAIRDITEQLRAEAEIQQLQEILPICSICKKIRDDKGYWSRLEDYFRQHNDTKFSHGYCPECGQKELEKIKGKQ